MGARRKPGPPDVALAAEHIIGASLCIEGTRLNAAAQYLPETGRLLRQLHLFPYLAPAGPCARPTDRRCATGGALG